MTIGPVVTGEEIARSLASPLVDRITPLLEDGGSSVGAPSRDDRVGSRADTLNDSVSVDVDGVRSVPGTHVDGCVAASENAAANVDSVRSGSNNRGANAAIDHRAVHGNHVAAVATLCFGSDPVEIERNVCCGSRPFLQSDGYVGTAGGRYKDSIPRTGNGATLPVPVTALPLLTWMKIGPLPECDTKRPAAPKSVGPGRTPVPTLASMIPAPEFKMVSPGSVLAVLIALPLPYHLHIITFRLQRAAGPYRSCHTKAQGISSPGTHEAMLMWPCKDGERQWCTISDWTCR
jgi:hypothetical protein